ncbi:MAG TPA: UDP-N-acetylglucosamine 2-epimerase (non-hydrolyzing) [Chitinophagaceae bacterium]|jgi:UDP-GlcNAc3NAcA epimerase
MKIVTVVGARPQFIKAAVISRAIQKRNDMQEVIVHTGQHYDSNMSDVFFDEMRIPKPGYNLEVKENLHGEMTAKMLTGVEKVLMQEKPDIVLVYGDTNSTLAASLAASKLHIPVAHVEAGLRSFNMKMPEEVNRILTDKVSTYLYCPTQQAVRNLDTEGFTQPFYQVHLTGDVMFDAVLYYYNHSNEAIIEKLKLQGKKFILATVHRAENTNNLQHLASIVEAFNKLHDDQLVVVPLHPRTAKLIHQLKIKPRFKIIEPVGYFDMLQLLHHCSIVITDSGGLQKEAYFFKKFSVVLREQTEWVELVNNGLCELAGSDPKKITDIVYRLLRTSFTDTTGLYGDGGAGEKIVDILEQHTN